MEAFNIDLLFFRIDLDIRLSIDMVWLFNAKESNAKIFKNA